MPVPPNLVRRTLDVGGRKREFFINVPARRGYERARADFARDPAAARALLAVGEKPATAGLDPVEHAALTTVASTLLCLDETVTKQ
jgi:hypothetical protein